jgi:tetratricopeptide (TPR) repeat protein
MDAREMETLIQRLVANPHDEEALAYAHRAGTQDPRSYAILLEKVGTATADPAYAAHWLSEAANVWSTTIGDAHHAARTLMAAIDKDPTQRVAAERLASLYREKGDQKGLAALLERLVKALTTILPERPEVRDQLIAMHEELGRLWSEPSIARPERAVENWRRLAELDPRNAYAIYAAREMLKSQQQWADALPFFAMELAIVEDTDRKIALYRDEADVRRRAGDLPGATAALRGARTYLPDDVALSQEVGTLILERIDAGEPVPAEERQEGARLFLSLAEMYDGEYGYGYSVSALRAMPGDDRAMQLADYYGGLLGKAAELGPFYAGYLAANPSGFMASVAQQKVGASRPPAPPPPPPAPVAAAAPAPVPAVAPAPVAPAPVPTPDPAANAPSQPPAAPPAAMADLSTLLEEAQAENQKGKKPQALAKYREALKVDPANPEALSWCEEYLRQKRMYADLRDVLLAASRVTTSTVETRKAQLRDVAGLCESQLRDVETAISAWKQIVQLDRGDEQARDQLRRLLEKGSRWDDLAPILEQEAMSAPDTEQKIALEKKLAQLHESKRKDPISAAEAWARIATLAPEDDTAVVTAVKLYEKGERLDLAAQAIADNVVAITDAQARGSLLQKLGELRQKLGDAGGAGEAFAEAAEALGQSKLWELAEKAFGEAGRPADVANALEQRAQLTDGKAQAALFAQAAEQWLLATEFDNAIVKLEQATELDPASDAYAASLEEQYRKADRHADLVKFQLARAERLTDRGKRTAARRAAAAVQRELGDKEGARETLELLLQDGDDPDALALLVEDAAERGDMQQQVELLRRLGAAATDPAQKLAHALREAELLADTIGDLEQAIERYEAIHRMDPKNRAALRAIADLAERRDDAKGAADALERELALAEDADRVEIAHRLAKLYEGPLADPRGAIRALDVVHAADPEDFDATARLLKLFEELEEWERVPVLLTALIEVEGDEDEASSMTRRLAEVLADRLNRGDEALAGLEKLADQGDEACRKAYVDLGDRLGWKGIVATKLVAWHESSSGPERNEALRGSFERFLSIGRESDAMQVAMELARSRGADGELASRLEDLASRAKDLDALGVAHEILARDLSGPARAAELVRQAEVLVTAGVDPLEAMQHGESALTSVPPAEVEPLLQRLAALTQAPGHMIDLYERQVGRCRMPPDRLAALARAAQVASERGATDRARGFFELALSGGVQEETISGLEAAARTGDERAGTTTLRGILAEALAAGGQGSRDGGRTRGALLRRAATIAHRDLGDVDRAFGWLGDAIVTHVDDASLEALESLGFKVEDMTRVEATLGRALEEVFDGPLVRKLLQRRAKLRREVLGDRKGAAVDLKKLHDLSPSDQDVMNELSALLLELGDHRGMIQLYEDQILRGRDPAVRADLARKVARIWEEDVGDAREAADAWRRVLRMKAGDPDATAGLDRAKSGKLRRPPPPPAMPAMPAMPSASAPPMVKRAAPDAPPVEPAPPVYAPPPAPAAVSDAMPLEAPPVPGASHAEPAFEPPPLVPVQAPAFAAASEPTPAMGQDVPAYVVPAAIEPAPQAWAPQQEAAPAYPASAEPAPPAYAAPVEPAPPAYAAPVEPAPPAYGAPGEPTPPAYAAPVEAAPPAYVAAEPAPYGAPAEPAPVEAPAYDAAQAYAAAPAEEPAAAYSPAGSESTTAYPAGFTPIDPATAAQYAQYYQAQAATDPQAGTWAAYYAQLAQMAPEHALAWQLQAHMAQASAAGAAGWGQQAAQRAHAASSDAHDESISDVDDAELLDEDPSGPQHRS